jgi:pimeloyl-ACP methyl ester carboxylesterase
VTPAPLVVLHGANGSAADLAPLLQRLGTDRPVFALDMVGHGGRPVPDQLTLADLVEDVRAQLDAQGVGPAHWFGYSVGGLVALKIAAREPDRFLSLATLTAKIVYDQAAISHAVHLADPDRVGRANPDRPDVLRRMHAPQDWMHVLDTVRRMFLGFADAPPITEAELARIGTPVLALGAMEDPIVPAAEVRSLVRLLPRATAALFPGTAHPIARAPLDTIVRTLARFQADPARMIRSAKVTLRDFRWDRP